MRQLTFLGAAGTVTGSKHLLETGGRRILVDCGLFQGMKELRLLNWEPFAVNPASIDTVVLTHAHIDHTGYLPRLIKQGFNGRVVATRATADLTAVLLRDSGKLQEEEAETHNRRGSSRHKPALPLYTEEDGIAAAERIEGFDYHQPVQLAPGIVVTFRPAGHILGSATVTFALDDGPVPRHVVFSGDLGRDDALLQGAPHAIGDADYVVMESTYGDRLHPNVQSPDDRLVDVVHAAVRRGGALIIPAFAVARTQSLLYLLGQLEKQGRIPILPVYLDSPMAIDATDLYRRHADELRPEVRRLLEQGERPLRTRNFHVTRSAKDSKAVNHVSGPMVILSASGMITGGRVLHHLQERLGRRETTVLIVGYQAVGTRGWRLQQGETSLRLFGEDVPVKATIESFDGLSAHGDQQDLVTWLQTSSQPPDNTFLVHGEGPSLDGLKGHVERTLGWPVAIPARGQSFRLRD